MMVVQGAGYTWLSLWCTGEGPAGKYNGPETEVSFEHRHVLYRIHRKTFGGLSRATPSLLGAQTDSFR